VRNEFFKRFCLSGWQKPHNLNLKEFNYMNKKIFSGLMLTAAVAVSGAANAAITGPTTIDFTGMRFSSVAGKANVTPQANGDCFGAGNNACYIEGGTYSPLGAYTGGGKGVVVGIVEDTSNGTAHIHREGDITAATLGYHSDSSGIYIRAQDSTAFSLTSFDFNAPIIVGVNPDTGANDVWEILGFSTALNPELGAGDGTNYATRVAYQTVANGFEGVLNLDPAFQNISAFWIHYKGYPQTPLDSKAFGMDLDNVVLNAPAAVPVPAAVWLFGSGLMGILASRRKKAA
jgi:hypothetical protein